LGGLVGALLTGVLADPAISGVEGSLATQAVACASVLGYSLVMTAVVLWVTSRITPLRVDEAQERVGLDEAMHAEQLGH
jgi:Amt family ammonium transporter